MSKSNPFKPGPGLTPPYLAGREQVQETLRSRLEMLAKGESVSIMVIYGPRGMGKTALLGWLKKQCAERKFRYVMGNPSNTLGSVGALAGKLLPMPWWLSMGRMKLGGRWANVDVEAPATRPGIESVLEKRLIKRCRRKPMVVLLDEAHAPSDPHVLRLFLNMAQEVAGDSPFLLVLAGTPQLDATLRNSKATFIERAEQIGLGCLDGEAAAAAISVPLEKDGVTIAKDAVEKAAEDGQGYPFFIQQWGEALWNHAMKKGVSELKASDVNDLMADIQTKRAGFYEPRFEAISESPELLAAANALAQVLLKDQRNLDKRSATEIIKNTLNATAPDGTDTEAKAQEIIRGLIRHDFLWRPPESRLMTPGIRSFIAYIRDRSSISGDKTLANFSFGVDF